MRRLETAQYRMNMDQVGLFYPNGEAIQEGETLIQSDLAHTLRMIAKKDLLDFIIVTSPKIFIMQHMFLWKICRTIRLKN